MNELLQRFKSFFLGISESHQKTLCLLLLLALHTGYYFNSGLYQCRYSLFEDQEILITTEKIKNAGVLEAFTEQIQYETRGRFRPFFVVYRIGACALFGDNIQWHHHFFYTVFVINTLLLFCWASLIGFSPLLSLMSSLLVFIGTQSNIGWRLANGENFAMLFLNVGILCFLCGLNLRKINFLLAGGLLILLAALNKESFIFCYGFFPLLYLRNTLKEKPNWGKFWSLSLLAAGCIGLYIICIRLFIMDPDAMKYAGSTISFKDVLELQFGMFTTQNYVVNYPRIWQTFIFQGSYFQPYILLFALTTGASCLYLPFRKFLLYNIAIALALLVVHKLLYLRIILSNIYLYPAIVTIGFAVINQIDLLFKHQKKLPATILLVAIISVIITQGKLSYSYAANYSSENDAAIALTDNLAKICTNTPLYIQADPLLHVEFIYGIKTRLKSLGCPSKFFCSVFEQGDTAEALRIMKVSDPALIPFIRNQFHKQFSDKIVKQKPETSLDGKNNWVVIQRPGKSPRKFEEVERGQYTQSTYNAPGFYTISTLLPTTTRN
ncbi:MAG: hypothetical protein V4615_13625 [Bacteroidota bacterium]